MRKLLRILDLSIEENASWAKQLKNKFVLLFWRISLLLVTPLWTIHVMSKKINWIYPWNPINPLTVLIAIILNFYLPLSDNASDLNVGLNYYQPDECGLSNPGLSLFIIAVTFLPFVVRLLLELKTTFGWIWNEWKLFLLLWREILKDQINVVFSMLPFISPFVNLAKIVRLS